MFELGLEFINGLKFGLEHITGDVEGEYSYMILLDIGPLRFSITHYTEEE